MDTKIKKIKKSKYLFSHYVDTSCNYYDNKCAYSYSNSNNQICLSLFCYTHNKHIYEKEEEKGKKVERE